MTNCQWIDPKLEALFTDSLSSEEAKLCESHMASCPDCRRQVESFKNVDTLIRGVMRHRTVLARRAALHPRRARVWKIGMAAAAGFAAIVIVLAAGWTFMQETPAPPVATIQPPDAPPLEETDKKDKVAENSVERAKPEDTVGRAKPEDRDAAEPAREPHLDFAAENGPDFAISDAAGYTYNLEFYRGRAFLFAVVSPDKKAAVSNLQQLYSNFGSNPGIRILGVARHRDDRFEGPPFPLYFNQGSRLMGVEDGEFILLDKTGHEQLKGSLADSRNLTRIRAQLARSGIQ